jgi:N-acetylglucosamine-6-sulfatase
MLHPRSSVLRQAVAPSRMLVLVATSLVLLLLSQAFVSAAPAHAADAVEGGNDVQPDIIVVMVDDFAYVPNERVLERLPTINELWLEGGKRFRRMYDETPLCCPARATFLSGQHTLTHGVIANDGDALDPSSTIATSLDDAGYHTLMLGKYLNRYEGTRTPPGWDRVFMRESAVLPSFSVDGELMRYDGQHFDNVLRRQTIDWLEEAPIDEPVFALVSPRAPHRHPQNCKSGQFNCQYQPLVIKRDRRAPECRDIRNFKPPTYEVPPRERPAPWSMPTYPRGWPLGPTCESMLVIDRMVAEILEVQAQRERPAYLVFMSDNGMSWGQKGFPLKHVPTATRLPFYVQGPDIEPGGTNVLLSNLDIAPTLADMGGAVWPEDDGMSFLPLLRGDEALGREELLEIMPADPLGLYDGWAGLRTPKWRYVRWDSGQVELYDVANDPWDSKNLAKKRRPRAKAMNARLEELIVESAEVTEPTEPASSTEPTSGTEPATSTESPADDA